MTRGEMLEVWVVGEWRALESPWADAAWTVVSVRPGSPEVAPGTVLAEGPGWRRHFLGRARIALYGGETANYAFNLASERPAVFVILRRGGPLGMTLLAVTVDPGEVDSHADSGDDLIEALPLPADIAGWVADFVARHHRERPRHKRRRDRADPDALGRRSHV